MERTTENTKSIELRLTLVLPNTDTRSVEEIMAEIEDLIEGSIECNSDDDLPGIAIEARVSPLQTPNIDMATTILAGSLEETERQEGFYTADEVQNDVETALAVLKEGPGPHNMMTLLLPYGMERKDLHLDHASMADELGPPQDALAEMRARTEDGQHDADLTRMLTAAVILKTQLGDSATMMQCLDTALVWEFG